MPAPPPPIPYTEVLEKHINFSSSLAAQKASPRFLLSELQKTMAWAAYWICQRF
jgi:hypothetical protein